MFRPAPTSYAQAAATSPSLRPKEGAGLPQRQMVRLGGTKPQPFADGSGRTVTPARLLPMGKGMRRFKPASHAPGALQAKAALAKSAAHTTKAKKELPPAAKAAPSSPLEEPKGGTFTAIDTTAASLTRALEYLQEPTHSPQLQHSPALSDRVSLPDTSPPKSVSVASRQLLIRRVSQVPSVSQRSQGSRVTADASSFSLVSPPNEQRAAEDWSVVGDDSDSVDEGAWTSCDRPGNRETPGSLPKTMPLGDPLYPFTVEQLEARLDALLYRDALSPAAYDQIYKQMAYASYEVNVGMAISFVERCVLSLALTDDLLPDVVRSFLLVCDGKERTAANVLYTTLDKARGKMQSASLADVASYLVHPPTPAVAFPDNDLSAVETRRKSLVTHWNKQPGGTWTLPAAID